MIKTGLFVTGHIGWKTLFINEDEIQNEKIILDKMLD